MHVRGVKGQLGRCLVTGHGQPTTARLERMIFTISEWPEAPPKEAGVNPSFSNYLF